MGRSDGIRDEPLIAADDVQLRSLFFRFHRRRALIVTAPQFEVDLPHFPLGRSSGGIGLLDCSSPVIVQFRIHKCPTINAAHGYAGARFR